MLDPILLRIAKTAIVSHFESVHNIDEERLVQKYPYLGKDGACFVTLNHQHQLRGCIGSIVAHRPLIEDIVQNALAAAFHDPRFAPLSASELQELTLEVSILSTPELLKYDDFDDLVRKVQPKIDGLILKHGPYQGTFLPQVWEQLPTSEQFLIHLSIKAGADESIYAQHPTIYRYKVDAIEENFDEVLPL